MFSFQKSRSSLKPNENETLLQKFYYTGRMRELIEGYNAAITLLFPKYPWYIFPGFMILSLWERYEKYYMGKYRLIPLPNNLYEILIKNEFIKSEHIIFAADDVYEKYAESKEVNFVNLIVSGEQALCSTQGHENKNLPEAVMKQMLNKAPQTIVAQILPAKNVFHNCLYVKENFFSNLKDRFRQKNSHDNRNFWVKLEPFSESQPIPSIATKSHIFFLNNPYEVPQEVLDLILGNFFNTPRIIHRGHTYRIEINADLVGTASYAHYFLIFAYLKQIYFRCVHLEVKPGDYEMHAIVAKNFTSLVQIQHSYHFLPRQLLNNLAITVNYPAGLKKTYLLLRSSIDAFLPKKSSCLSSKQIYPMFLIQGERGCGKTKLVNAVAQDLGMHLFGIDCAEIVSQVPSHTELKLKSVFGKSIQCEPLMICFHNFEVSIQCSI